MDDTYALQLQSTMTDQQRLAFQGEYFARRKDPVIGILLAVFLGSFGAHRFYLGQNGIAIIYILFCWTAIPGFIALIEAFFMPARIRRWNDQMAAEVANRVRMGYAPVAVAAQLASAAPPPIPGTAAFCTHCGKPIPGNAQFCSACGKGVTMAMQA